MVELLTTAGSPARRRYDQAVLDTRSTTVASNELFPSCRLRRCPVEHNERLPMCLVLVPLSCTVTDFARDVGIKNPQHMSEVVGGGRGRYTCHNWQGALVSSAGAASVPTIGKIPKKNGRQSRLDRLPGPYTAQPVQRRAVAAGEYCLAPQHPDPSWYAGLLSRELVTPQGPLMPEGCPARRRFDYLIIEFPTGVPLDKLFPEADLCMSTSDRIPTVHPQCSPRDFGNDVGMQSTQHLSEVIRGVPGRDQCCGWIGALNPPQRELPTVDVQPAAIDVPIFGHEVQPRMVDLEDWDLTTDYLDNDGELVEVIVDFLPALTSDNEACVEIRESQGFNDDVNMLADVMAWTAKSGSVTTKPTSPSATENEVVSLSRSCSISNEQMDMLMASPSLALALFPGLDTELLQTL